MSKPVTPYKDATGTKKEQVATMFDNISKTYDFLNHFLSLGIDVIWRKKAIRLLKTTAPKVLLDVATGTGDFAFESYSLLKPEKIIGIDISQGMLEVAKEKIAKRGLGDHISVQLGDSEALPFETAYFDAVTVAFGVRNFENIQQGLNEIQRVLKPGGKAIVLEFSNPKAFPIKQLYPFYFKRVLPFFGKIFSKDNSAYTYLPDSVAQFPEGEAFLKLLKQAGFSKTKARPQTFGICTIYEAEK